jgi:hypothetical protein
MARTVTLGALRARVRALADIGGDTSSGRYPDTRINTLINDAWQRMREIVVNNGDGQMYLRQTGPTLMAQGPMDSTSSFGFIKWPSEAVAIHGIDVVFDMNNIVPLQPMSFGDRNLFSQGYFGAGQVTGRPMGFCILNTGEEVNTEASSGTIAIFPAPDQQYTYTCWFVPVWQDRTEDDHVFAFPVGGDAWVAWDCVIQIAAGDADMQQVAQIAMAERDKAEAAISVRANRLQRVAPLQRRDTAGQQRSRWHAARWWRR